MAIFHFNTVVFNRGSGHSAVRGAAYRAGVALMDERAGKMEDYTRKQGVAHAEIIAPENAPAWVYDRAALWNAVERAEDKSTRRNEAQLAYSITVALPYELTEGERHDLVRGFVSEKFVSLGMVADVAFHAPHEAGDDRNHHAHIMLTMRHLQAEGFGNKARDWQSHFGRFCNGRLVETHQLVALRADWAEHTNAALERAGHAARIDHRSLEAQGIDREATVHLGPSATAQERQGIQTERGDQNREIEARNAEVIDLAAERERREQAQREEADKSPAAALGIAETVAAYKAARQEAGRLWSGIWQEVGGNTAKDDAAKTQARRRAFKHADYPAYAEARDRRNEAALAIHADREAADPHLKALHIRPAALEADIQVARGIDRETAERERREREQAAELARLERKQARVERVMEATATRLRDRLTAEKDAGPAAKAADILNAITTYAPTFKEIELAGLVRECASDAREARAITAAIDRSGEVLDLYDPATGKAVGFTTRSQREREQTTLQNADRLAGRGLHRATDRGIGDAIAVHTLRPEQQAVLRHATGCEGLALIDGKAGTGKSYALGAIRYAYERSGNAVVGLAPTRKAAAGLRDVGFEKPTTVHGFLRSIEHGKVHYPQGTVLIVDEAAMLDTRTLGTLAQHAAERSWKLILAGDAKQLASVEAGGLFGVLQTRHGAASLTDVVRQRQADHKDAAEHFARYEFAEGLALLDKGGAIQMRQTVADAKAALVADWAIASTARPDASRFVFAYTNAEAREVNAAIRAVRVARGEIDAGVEVATTTGAAAFARGDRVSFMETSHALGIDNGTVGTILNIDEKMMTVRMDGDRRQDITFPHGTFSGFAHGYAGTIYKGQGATLDETFLLHSHHWRDASSYVALTRHRDSLRVYAARDVAQDIATLAKQMTRSDERPATVVYDTREEAHRRAVEREEQTRRGAVAPGKYEGMNAPSPMRQLWGRMADMLNPFGPGKSQGLRPPSPEPPPQTASPAAKKNEPSHHERVFRKQAQELDEAARGVRPIDGTQSRLKAALEARGERVPTQAERAARVEKERGLEKEGGMELELKPGRRGPR